MSLPSLISASSGSANRAVVVKQGRLLAASDSGHAVAVFRGVPYATPPVGDLRWRAPRPPSAWQGTRVAEKFGPAAEQYPVKQNSLFFGGAENTSEDCLYLNIWTPARDGAEKLPVIVWLHLGGFAFGAGSVPNYDGTELARAGAVVVTINYRLGVLGFMAHPELTAESEHGSSGNYGLLDQIAALRWVRDNIAGFGGDRDNVTVTGLSAGSASVSMLMSSPLADGLFAKAIAMSAGLLGPVDESNDYGDGLQDLAAAERTGLQFARLAGADGIAELRELPAQALLLLSAGLTDGPRWVMDSAGVEVPRGAFDGVYPIVDGWVVPESPYDLWAAGRESAVPLLTGSAADEKAGMPHLTSVTDWERYLLEYDDLAAELRAHFPVDDDVSSADLSARTLADRIFIWQNWTMARLHSRHAPTYYYHTSYAPPAPSSVAEVDPGAYHGCEIPYLFRHLDQKDWAWSAADYERSEVVSRYWLNFARTGDPNGDGLPRWATFDVDSPRVQHFGATVGESDVPRREVLDFWDRFFESRRRRAASEGAAQR